VHSRVTSTTQGGLSPSGGKTGHKDKCLNPLNLDAWIICNCMFDENNQSFFCAWHIRGISF